MSRLVLAVMLLGLSALTPPSVMVSAAPLPFTVTTTDDTPIDANCTAASCTLRQAVNASNANDPGAGNFNSIAFALPAGPQTITLANGQVDLMKNLTIVGPGASILTVDGNNTTRGFRIEIGVTVSLSGLTVANGYANPRGGAIDDGGTLTVTGCAFTNNYAYDNGGAIYASGGALTVTDSAFSGNGSGKFGSAIDYVGPATFALAHSVITGGTGAASGAVYSSIGALTVTDTTISGNAGYGITSAVPSSVTSSAIVGNAGGIANISSGSMTLTNSTIANSNDLSDNGSGIFNTGTLTITNSTVSGNRNGSGSTATSGILNTGTLTLRNTIVAGNNDAGTTDINGSVAAGSTNNLIGVGDGATGIANGASGNRVGSAASPLDPRLGPLGINVSMNGTQTLALLPGSPAIDAGDDAICAAPLPTGAGGKDQRGIARPQGAACDIGAYERFDITPLPQPMPSGPAQPPAPAPLPPGRPSGPPNANTPLPLPAPRP